MKRTLIVLGGTGDLTGRLLLPSLAHLEVSRPLEEDLEILAVSRRNWDDDGYRQWARGRLSDHAPQVPADARDRLPGMLGHLPGDVADPAVLRAALERATGTPIVYLALPNTIFRPTLEALTQVTLPEGTKIVVEKPFGRDRADAQVLDRLLHRLVPEHSVFRIDHYLALQTALNILGLRFANRLVEPVWNAGHVERVEIVVDETLGLEGRAGYYDTAGALRDMLQNHLLQLLALVAMDPPHALDDTALPARKADVLRAVQPPADMARDTVRGRYTAGTIGDRRLPNYVDEPGVDPSRKTETYAEFTVTVDNWRWAGVPFRLRTGKALGCDHREVAVYFRPVPHSPFAGTQPEPNVLRMGFDPDTITLEINLNGSGDPFDLERDVLDAHLPPQEPPYAVLLRELVTGDTTLSISDVEAEESWRIVEPILAAWAADDVPLREYPAGSAGPID